MLFLSKDSYNRKLANKKLVVMPKLQMFEFYLNSIIIGFWYLIKYFLLFLWRIFNQKRLKILNKNKFKFSGGYYGNNSNRSNGVSYSKNSSVNNLSSNHYIYHDKPPSCLVDSSYGRHSYVKLKGVKLHYIESGSRNDPLILLLHGYPDCWLGWRKQISQLSKFFRVVVLDLKGFNDSDKPLWRHEYTPEKICYEILCFIKSLDCKTATIVGHDLGGLIGWMFAHLYPDHIDRFICVSTSHPNLFWDNLSTKSTVLYNKSFIKFLQLPFLPEIELSSQNGIESSSSGVYLEKIFKETNDSVLNAYKYVFSRKSDWTGPLNYYRNFPFYRICEGDVIRCPVLIVAGNVDPVCKLETVVKSSDYCDNFTVKIIDGANHWPHQENAPEFNLIMLKFLVGRRATEHPKSVQRTNSKGLISRVFGAVANNSVGKIGGYVIDTVQHKTNEAFMTAIHS